jgi:hypothetical protein
MTNLKNKKDRLLTQAIVVFALAGILYFGYMIVLEGSRSNQENPFEYNIEHFKQSAPELLHYSQVNRIDIHLHRLYGLALSPEDKIYVSGDNFILSLDQNGDVSSKINCGKAVHALAIDEKDDIYLATNDHIEIYDSSGVFQNRWDPLENKPLITSITINQQYVFVADAGNHIVWKYDKSGKVQGRIGEEDETRDIPGFIIPSPYFDLAIDPDGFLWVVNPGRHSLENYTDTGELRSFWGSPSMSIEGFCGCCNPTHIAILRDGSFVTSEKGIARVKIYNRLGHLISLVAGPDQFIEGTEGLDLAVDSEQRIYVLDPKQKAIRIFAKNNETDKKHTL